MSKIFEYVFQKKGYINGKYAKEKTVTIISPSGHANQSTMRYHYACIRIHKIKDRPYNLEHVRGDSQNNDCGTDYQI